MAGNNRQFVEVEQRMGFQVPNVERDLGFPAIA